MWQFSRGVEAEASAKTEGIFELAKDDELSQSSFRMRTGCLKIIL
jgi:hypothetical protein